MLATNGTDTTDSPSPSKVALLAKESDAGTGINYILLGKTWDSFDREEEDFSLDVGSPGLDKPLKVLRQYLKLIGKQVSVNPKDGKKMEGELVNIEEENGEVKGLVLKTREKKRIEGRKAKQWVEEEHRFQASDIEWTKVIISFK